MCFYQNYCYYCYYHYRSYYVVVLVLLIDLFIAFLLLHPVFQKLSLFFLRNTSCNYVAIFACNIFQRRKKKEETCLRKKSPLVQQHSKTLSPSFAFYPNKTQAELTRRKDEKEKRSKASTNVLDRDKTVCQLYPAHLTFTLMSTIPYRGNVRPRIAFQRIRVPPSAKKSF